MPDSLTAPVAAPADQASASLPLPSPSSAPRAKRLALPRAFQALRHRNFRLFMMGQLVSLVGTWMEQTALGWLVFQLTGSKFLLGVVAAAGTLPMLFFAPWGGSLADQFPKRRILLITQSMAMTLALLMATLVWTGRVQPWQIVAIALLNGIAMAFDWPTRQSFIMEVAGREDLLNAISLNSAVFNSARMVGPAVAGLAVVTFGAATCFFLNGASFLAVIAGLLLMRVAPPAPRPRISSWEHVSGGLRYVWNQPRAFGILSLFAAIIIFGWSYMALLPAIASDRFGADARGFGALASSIGLGALLSSLWLAAVGDKYSPRAMMLGGLTLFSAAQLLFSGTRWLPLGVALQAAAHFGMVVYLSTSQTALQRSIPDEMQGRVMGIWSLTVGAMLPLGNVAAGALAGRWGLAPTMALGALVCAACTLAFALRRGRGETNFIM